MEWNKILFSESNNVPYEYKQQNVFLSKYQGNSITWVLPLGKYEILLKHLLIIKKENISDSLFENLNVMLYFL